MRSFYKFFLRDFSGEDARLSLIILGVKKGIHLIFPEWMFQGLLWFIRILD